jgi:hypothetical protein
MEASVKLTRALEIAGKARIRRRIASPSDNTAQVSPPPERPVALRDTRGRYLKGWAGGPGRPPRDALTEAYINDLFAVWRRHGRQALRQVCQEDPATYLRLMMAWCGRCDPVTDMDATTLSAPDRRSSVF